MFVRSHSGNLVSRTTLLERMYYSGFASAQFAALINTKLKMQGRKEEEPAGTEAELTKRLPPEQLMTHNHSVGVNFMHFLN